MMMMNVIKSFVRQYTRDASRRKRARYVPDCAHPSDGDVRSLQDFVNAHPRMVILTGAGLSTESGIPDYRSPIVGIYARKDYKPMQHKDFISSEATRQRYWARSFVGWPIYSLIQPSTPHRTLVEWEHAGMFSWLITQNVDHLHVKAGSKKVTELHGSLYKVRCLSCNHVVERQYYQEILTQLNRDWSVQNFEIATDGDVIFSDDQVQGFKVAPCDCGGDYMPHVVFFGATVAKPVVDWLYDQVEEADAILTLGSSLHVYSGYRFVRAAHEQGKPVCIVNIGETRADIFADIKLESRCGDILPLINTLGSLGQ